MIKKIIILITVCINTSLAIGLKALVIPQSASVMSTSNTGIANAISSDINPAALSNINPFFGFSRNLWLGDLQGQKTSIKWDNKGKYSQFSFESLKISNIELRDEIASEDPLGFFGAYWYAFDFSRSLNLEKIFLNQINIDIGYKIKLYLSKLYTESMYGAAIDIGIQKKINTNLSCGFVLKNYGKEYDGNLNANTPKIAGLGISYKITKLPLSLLLDIVTQDDKTITKILAQTNFKYINMTIGSSKSNNYKDIAFGLHINLNKWSLVYGNLNHDNSNLGDPYSIELRKYF